MTIRPLIEMLDGPKKVKQAATSCTNKNKN
jgi:hypothetical protein